MVFPDPDWTQIQLGQQEGKNKMVLKTTTSEV
jgi:hypothetical protein